MKRKIHELGDEKNPYERVQNLKRYRLSKEREKPKIEVVYSEKDLLIINKPHDLHIDGDKAEYSVKSLVREQFPSFYVKTKLKTTHNQPNPNKKLRFCHQLDYATSGILCLAFTRQSCSKVGMCFINRTSKKEYLAIVFGHVEKDEEIIKSNIDKDPEDPNHFMMRNFDLDSGIGRYSETKVEVIQRGVLKSDESVKVSKVILRPKTGRRHQLRLHMSKIGHCILGDCTYAKDSKTIRMCLHAHRLFLPCIGEKGTWLEAPDPFLDFIE